MLKRNNFIAVCILFMVTLVGFTACCDEDLPPTSRAFSVYVIGLEGREVDLFEDENWFVNAGLYNDEISDECLRWREKMRVPNIPIYEGDFKNDNYEGVSLSKECEALKNGTGKFYCLVNVPGGDNYLPEYETFRIDYKSNDYEYEVFLKKKSSSTSE